MKRKEKGEKQDEDFSQNEALFSRKGNFSDRGRNSQHRRGGRHQRYSHWQDTRQKTTDQCQGQRCFKCQQIGHIVKNCPLNRKNHLSYVAEEGTRVNKQDGDDGEIALNSTSTRGKQNGQWFIDSDATKHKTFQRHLIVDYIKYKQPTNIYLGDNRVIKAYGEGKVKLRRHSESDVVTLVLNKVLYVPEITKNLLSVSAMTQMGAEVLFNDGKCYVTKDGRTISIGHLVNSKLYL